MFGESFQWLLACYCQSTIENIVSLLFWSLDFVIYSICIISLYRWTFCFFSFECNRSSQIITDGNRWQSLPAFSNGEDVQKAFSMKMAQLAFHFSSFSLYLVSLCLHAPFSPYRICCASDLLLLAITLCFRFVCLEEKTIFVVFWMLLLFISVRSPRCLGAFSLIVNYIANAAGHRVVTTPF